MPYIGKVDVKASDIKRFDVTGSTSATHTLSWTAPSEQSLIITINGVKQQDSAYTISGSPTTITLASALVATDEMEVIGINDIGQTNTLAQDSIVTDMIRDDTVTTAKIADDQITSAKLANAINITSGNSLTIDSGATVTNNGTTSGFGSVKQVVSYSDYYINITSSTSYSSTSIAVTLTPSSSSNKIIVMCSAGWMVSHASNPYANARIYNSTDGVVISTAYLYGKDSSGGVIDQGIMCSMVGEDTGRSAATTYVLQHAAGPNYRDSRMGYGGTKNWIIAMEVEA